MKPKLLLFTILTLGTCAPWAQAADKWLTVRSRNFFLVGNASESAMRRVDRNLEEFRAAFTALFPGVSQESSKETTVIVFKDDDSFRPYKPLYQGKPANVSGYFQQGNDVNFIALTGDIQTPRVIFHEYVHSLTKDGKLRLPTWISEGIAEFYSTLDAQADGKEVIVGKIIENHIITLNQLPLISLETMFDVQPSSPYYNEDTKQGIFYAESWALTHYLMLARENQREGQLSRYLAALSSGKSSEDSFHEAFQTDYPVLEEELRRYMQSRVAWPGIRYKLGDKIDFDKDIQVSPLSEARAQFYLGDLLVHTDRLPEAEKQLQKAIQMEPGFAGNYASMGLMRLRQERRDEALQFLTRAVESDSQNYLTHYYYATLLQQVSNDQNSEARNERLRLMRTHLKRAIELSPRFIEAYGMLGYVSTVLRDELPETEALLKKAISFAPGRQELSLDLAQIMMANNDPYPARAILGPLANSADEAIRERAQTLLSYIQTRLEQEQSVQEYEERRRAAGFAPADAENEADDANARGTASAGAAVDPADNSSRDAVPTLRRQPASPADVPPARTQGLQVEGLLTLIDCSRGVTLLLQVGNGRVELHAEDPSKIQFNSNVAAVKDAIACGPVNPPVAVEVKYRRTTDPTFLGEPISVLFVEKK